MEKEYRCAIIGQHPMRFPWGFDEEDTQCRRMKLELAQCIMELRQCGVTDFQVACDPGVGLYAGEIVNITKQNDEAMRLVCVTPFEEQAMVTKVYAHILDEDRKVNAQKFESAFYANPDLRGVQAPAEPAPALDVQSIILQLQQSPELLSALTSLISNQGCK